MPGMRPLCSIDHVAAALHAHLAGNEAAMRSAVARAACDLALPVDVVEAQVRATAERSGLVTLVGAMRAELAVLRDGIRELNAQAIEALARPVTS